VPSHQFGKGRFAPFSREAAQQLGIIARHGSSAYSRRAKKPNKELHTRSSAF
jgi:hypothetical protein